MTSAARSGQVLDQNGIPVQGASVYIYDAYGNIAAITSNGTTSIPNPLTTDQFGNYSYQAVIAYYREDIWFNGQKRWSENNVALGSPGADLNLRSDLTVTSDPTKGAALVNFLQSGIGAVARTAQSRFTDTVSILDFGGVGDGVTDNHAAIAAAAAAARGKSILFPKGNYVINTNGGTITLEEVDLVGQHVLDGATGAIDQGSMLWITGTTNSPFNIRRGVSIESLGIYYPNQVDSASPTSYPSTLAFDFADGAVQFVRIANNAVYNAYEFVHIDNGSTGGVGHVEIENNYICALNRGIYLRYNSEHFRIERNNFTFGFWLAATEAGCRGFMRANAIAIQIDQTDGIEIVDNMVFGHLKGVLTAAQALCQFMNVTGNKFDQTRYGVSAIGSGNFVGIIGGNTFNAYNSQNTALQGRSIDIETTGVAIENIAIFGNHFAAATEDHVYISGNAATRRIVVGANNWLGWAAYKAAGSYAALNVSGSLTNLQVNGGDFSGSTSPAYSNGILGTMNVLQVSGAKFDLTIAPINATAGIATITGNRSTNTSGSTSDLITSSDIAESGNKWDKPTSVVSTVSAGTYTVGARDASLICTVASTLTLPAASSNLNRELMAKTTGANAISSASSNVVGLTGGAAGTSILAATGGKWARLVSDGTNWQIMSAN